MKADKHRLKTSGKNKIAPPALRRRAKPRKQGDERGRKAMQAGSDLSGGLGAVTIIGVVVGPS